MFVIRERPYAHPVYILHCFCFVMKADLFRKRRTKIKAC